MIAAPEEALTPGRKAYLTRMRNLGKLPRLHAVPDEVETLRARVRQLEAEVASLREARVPKRRLKRASADGFATPQAALSAWMAADPEARPMPGWRKAVFDDWGALPRAVFRARMTERIEGTRALADRRRVLFACQAERIAGGAGLHVWDDETRGLVTIAWRVRRNVARSAAARLSSRWPH